jgi:tRNA (cmo5U34)-methyltransferase
MNTVTDARIFGCPLKDKSTVEEIRAQFDQDVERFSRLETGQQAVADAPVHLELVARSAAGHLQPGGSLLDLGCGAGNYTLRVLREVSPLDCHLVDLSRPMLDRACARIRAAGVTTITARQSDLRHLDYAPNTFDCVVAAAVLHHLREASDWERVFTLIHQWLKPGGRLYVADLIIFDAPKVQAMMWERYGQYLESLGGAPCREKVFDHIAKEDSPRSLPFQVALAGRVGFSSWEVLHRNGVCASYYVEKP